jgi:hypothetical protein
MDPAAYSSDRRTLELSCEAPIGPGFVSFNSLLGRLVFTSRALLRQSIETTLAARLAGPQVP